MAPVPVSGTPFGPRLHAVATYLKTYQALSYERLQAALADLFGLRLSQGGLMNLLRRAQGRFQVGREAAVATLRRAEMVASDETGVRIEGCSGYHWVFRCQDAVVHQAASTRAASVVRTMMDGHRPAVWLNFDLMCKKYSKRLSSSNQLKQSFHICSYIIKPNPSAFQG